VLAVTERADDEGFGGCTNHGECEAACPKGIPLQFIGEMNGDYLRATLRRGRRVHGGAGAAG
jgi:succinate dehydrogenase / fumarate reductase iron-sulfur subunit